MRKSGRVGLFLACMLLLNSVTGCGGSGFDAGSNGSDFSINTDSMSKSESWDGVDSMGFDSFNGNAVEVGGDSAVGSDFEMEEVTGVSPSLKKEMLVYTCSLAIDTLNFDDSVNGFKGKLGDFGGFIENEEYSNGRSGYATYYRDDEELFRSYSAVVRVPSVRYEEFVDGVCSFGDVRSKDAYVENVSQEYYDIQTTLEIYEAKQERYINLLKTIQEDSYAIEVERELTDIQIEIARLKTRMNSIETDVAYSYVDVSIREVKEYVEKPVQRDTFLQRLRNTVVGTVEGFMLFLEDTLFFVIGVSPYVVILVLIFWLTRPLRRRMVVGKIGKVKGYQPSSQRKGLGSFSSSNKEGDKEVACDKTDISGDTEDKKQ